MSVYLEIFFWKPQNISTYRSLNLYRLFTIPHRFLIGLLTEKKYVAYIREALLEHVQKNNVVYHGLAGHLFLQGIPHVLKVRITADLENRIKRESEKGKISAEEARNILVKDDDERRKWSLYLYNIDTWDSRLYDLVLHIGQITVDDAVSVILHTVSCPVLRQHLRPKVLSMITYCPSEYRQLSLPQMSQSK